MNDIVIRRKECGCTKDGPSGCIRAAFTGYCNCACHHKNVRKRPNVKGILANPHQRKALLDQATKAVSMIGEMGGGPHTIALIGAPTPGIVRRNMHESCLCELPRTVEELKLAVMRYSSALDEACHKLARLDRRLTAQQWRDEIWTFAKVKGGKT